MSSASTSKSILTVDSDNCTSLSIIISNSNFSISPVRLLKCRLKNALHIDGVAELIGVPMHHFSGKKVRVRSGPPHLDQVRIARPGGNVKNPDAAPGLLRAQQWNRHRDTRPFPIGLRRNLFE